jgi:hypothetical protein
MKAPGDSSLTMLIAGEAQEFSATSATLATALTQSRQDRTVMHVHVDLVIHDLHWITDKRLN